MGRVMEKRGISGGIFHFNLSVGVGKVPRSSQVVWDIRQEYYILF
jgi:hypothetical protein